MFLSVSEAPEFSAMPKVVMLVLLYTHSMDALSTVRGLSVFIPKYITALLL